MNYHEKIFGLRLVLKYAYHRAGVVNDTEHDELDDFLDDVEDRWGREANEVGHDL